MRKRGLILPWTVTSMLAAASCADILGIDDGKPRDYDASVDAAVDAAPDVKETSVDDAFSPLSCGAGTTCNFAIGEVCCRTSKYQCVDASSACTGTTIPCDRTSQCPQNTEAGAMLCCTTNSVDDGGIYIADTVGCLPAAQCQPEPQHYIMCGNDSSADCPPEAGCGQSASALPPFLICK
ncbi:MAG TPA: hypothetical protein VGH87_24775 [Polyangiaceae bacterium]